MARSAFDTVIRLQLQKYGPEAAKKKHIEIATRGLAAFQKRQSAPLPYSLIVDGHTALSEQEVKPYGVIIYQFNRLGQIAQEMLDFLIRYVTQAYSGEYHKNFFISVDGKQIDAADFRPKFVPLRAEIIIGNKLPFNRKFDVQQIGNRVLSYKVDPYLYAAAVVYIKSKYGGIIEAKRIYNVSFGGKYVLRGQEHLGKYKLRKEQFHGPHMGARAGQPRNRRGMTVDSPGIILAMKV